MKIDIILPKNLLIIRRESIIKFKRALDICQPTRWSLHKWLADRLWPRQDGRTNDHQSSFRINQQDQSGPVYRRRRSWSRRRPTRFSHSIQTRKIAWFHRRIIRYKWIIIGPLFNRVWFLWIKTSGESVIVSNPVSRRSVGFETRTQ